MTNPNLSMMKPSFSIKPFASMEQSEADAYFMWFLEQIPVRIEYLRKRYEAGGNTLEDLNFSPGSLMPLWEWFHREKLLPYSEEELQCAMKENETWLSEVLHFSRFNHYDITYEQFFVAFDIALYFIEVLRLNHPELLWQLGRFSPVTNNINQPVIAGFKYGVELNP